MTSHRPTSDNLDLTVSDESQQVSHAGLTFTYLGWGRAFGNCSCGWPTQTVRFGRYDRIVREWDDHKAETHRG